MDTSPKIRYLLYQEIAIARPVFRDSLPWLRISVDSALGFEQRAYTIGRRLHVGPDHFSKGMHLSNGGGSLLVHELTHVWQSEHGVHRAAYIGKSIVAQLAPGDAYAYQPGKNWEDYNPEQQASIVEDWYFQDGQSSSSQLFPYIQNHIWTKKISPDNRIEYPL